jgi:hypothetical protein
MATWPTYATIKADSFSEEFGSQILETSMDSGPPKSIVVRSLANVKRSFIVIFQTKAAYVTFKGWVRSTIASGSAPFDWTDPVDASVKTARLVGGVITDVRPMSGNSAGPWQGNVTIQTLE